jgi:hypothetical protein
MSTFCLRLIVASVVFASAATLALAVEPAAKKAASAEAATGESVDVFEAMKNDQIDVKFVAMSATKANLVIENKTKKPLTITMPPAVAGVPVLAQVDAGTQGVGGPPGGAFNIAPEKTRKIEMPCVCLEHGKADPYSKIPYELKPIAAISDKPEVEALLVRYGKGDISAQVAQAAAWNLQNGMSWQELAAKELKDGRGLKSPYFSKKELAAAMKLAEGAVAHAKEKSGGKAGFEAYSPGVAK